MKQLTFLKASKSTPAIEDKKGLPKDGKTLFELYTDGASKGNPGPAGVGIYCLKNRAIFFKQGFFAGYGTNNFAEYCALLCGLAILKKQTAEISKPRLNIFCDSQLLVYQINGLYKTKNLVIINFTSKIKSLLQNFSWSIMHIPREKNKEADKLANQGIVERIELPNDLKHLINPEHTA